MSLLPSLLNPWQTLVPDIINIIVRVLSSSSLLSFHPQHSIFTCCGSRMQRSCGICVSVSYCCDGLFSEKKHENLFQKQKQNKYFFRHSKTRRVRNQQTCTTVNVKRPSFNGRKVIPDGDMDPHNRKKDTKNGKTGNAFFLFKSP